ncbi:MAG: efflux RND transporter periplasmic adaptor subunit [Candidatus Zixiibacteriota bacterium]
MKTIILAVACLVIGFAAAYFWREGSRPVEAAVNDSESVLYTCGMHPEVISTEPGTCPICGMDLVVKKGDAKASGLVQIDPTTRQNMGLVTTEASLQSLSKRVRAFGKVMIADPNHYDVNLKVGGWVEKLFVNETGERVFKGQPLLEIYSPQLVTAQREYLTALASSKSADNLKSLLELSESRLKNWDITEDQLNDLREAGKVSRTMTIRAPSDGFVIKKFVNEGMEVAPGATLYEIADLSTVWVSAYVYEQDLPYVALKQDAEVTTPGLPGRIFDSRVIYVSPSLNPKGQVQIRLEMANPHFELRPEMYAEVELQHRSRHAALVVPRSAVINSGKRQVVYVASTDDTFEPRTVTTGAVDENDMIEIVSGIGAGEKVVTSGQFLLDSESRLSEAVGQMGGHQHGSQATVGDNTVAMTSDDQSTMDQSMEGHDHAQQTSDPHNIHTCPMPQDYDVLHYGPGKCPKCGMALVPVSETDIGDVWVCPMPQDSVAQREPGVCPVCGMKLIKYEPGASHDH